MKLKIPNKFQFTDVINLYRMTSKTINNFSKTIKIFIFLKNVKIPYLESKQLVLKSKEKFQLSNMYERLVGVKHKFTKL